MIQQKSTVVFGISGVGKTTACLEYAKTNDKTVCVSAGDILKKIRNEQTEVLRLLPAERIIYNQYAIAHHIRNMRIPHGGRLLIDAHATIHNGRETVFLPADVFSSFNPGLFILLEADASLIMTRLLKDTRARQMRTEDDLRLQMIVERQAVTKLSTQLNVELRISETADRVDLASLMG